MENCNGKWMYNVCGSDMWDSSEYFDTKEEAIRAGRQVARENNEDDPVCAVDTFDVGCLSQLCICVDADSLIDAVRENVDENGCECDDWLETPRIPYWGTDEEKAAAAKRRDEFMTKVSVLQERLTDVFVKWCEEIGEPANFYTIENVQTLPVEED